jgi:hypothetical protein
LKEKDEIEERQFVKKCQELESIIEKNKQVKDFIQTQEEAAITSTHKEFNNKHTISSNIGSLSTGPSIPAIVGTEVYKSDNLNELINSEKLLRKKTCEKAFAIAREICVLSSNDAQENSNIPQAHQYEEALNEIKEAAMVNDQNEIIDEFQKTGEQNLMLGKFVDEVENEVGNLDTEIEEIK